MSFYDKEKVLRFFLPSYFSTKISVLICLHVVQIELHYVVIYLKNDEISFYIKKFSFFIYQLDHQEVTNFCHVLTPYPHSVALYQQLHQLGPVVELDACYHLLQQLVDHHYH
jgi:hypothetical protein